MGKCPQARTGPAAVQGAPTAVCRRRAGPACLGAGGCFPGARKGQAGFGRLGAPGRARR